MDVRRFGYIQSCYRIQNESVQLEKMKVKGINEINVFIDKRSSKGFNQIQYQKLKSMLKKGDVLYVHSLNHLGQNKEELFKEWNDITKNIQADIVVIDIPLLDTTQFKGSLGTYISDLILQILSWSAQDERERIQKQTREVIRFEKQKDKTLGRPKVEITEDFEHVYSQWKSGEIKAVVAMKKLGLKKTTFYKLAKEYENSFV